MEVLNALLDTTILPLAFALDRNNMEGIGIGNTMRIARSYNRLRYGRRLRHRRWQYRHHFHELLEANGRPATSLPAMCDGWSLSPADQLPHLDNVLRDAAEIIHQRGGVRSKLPGKKSYIGSDKPFIQNIITKEDLEAFPSILDFATSSEVLRVVCDYFDFVPCLSSLTPPGVRLMESWAKFDDANRGYYASQLFHLDNHDRPMVYVILPIHDIAEENGPFCFLPSSVSRDAARRIGYRKRGRPFRVPDDAMYAAVDKEHLVTFCSPAGGNVLFVDSSNCFHYGSRDAKQPRYQLMYAFVSPCRTDFTEIVRKGRTWIRPPRPTDSMLQRLVLCRSLIG